jgi:hypothetical protein
MDKTNMWLHYILDSSIKFNPLTALINDLQS